MATSPIWDRALLVILVCVLGVGVLVKVAGTEIFAVENFIIKLAVTTSMQV